MNRTGSFCASLGMAFLLVGLGASLAPEEVAAQEGPQGAAYELITPGSLQTLTVFVWGDIARPGLYVISDDIDLMELVTLAGTPQPPTVGVNTRVAIDIEVLRPGNSASDPIVYEADYASFIRDRATHPQLREGDVVNVRSKTSQRFTWRDITTVVGTAATLTLLVIRINDFTR